MVIEWVFSDTAVSVVLVLAVLCRTCYTDFFSFLISFMVSVWTRIPRGFYLSVVLLPSQYSLWQSLEYCPVAPLIQVLSITLQDYIPLSNCIFCTLNLSIIAQHILLALQSLSAATCPPSSSSTSAFLPSFISPLLFIFLPLSTPSPFSQQGNTPTTTTCGGQEEGILPWFYCFFSSPHGPEVGWWESILTLMAVCTWMKLPTLP